MRAALDTLVAADPRLAIIEAAAGPLPWRTRPQGFPGLLQAIVAQVVSSQAAAAIWHRMAALPGVLVPETLLRLPDDALRQAGLSGPKIAHARALAEAFVSGQLSIMGLQAASDADALAAITAVRDWGHGRPKSICCSRCSGPMSSRLGTSRLRAPSRSCSASTPGQVHGRFGTLRRFGARPAPWRPGCCGTIGGT